VTDSSGATASQSFTFTVALPPTPPVTLTGPPPTSNPATQSNLQITLGTPFPVAVTVNLTMTFAPLSGGDDPAVQFSTGGRTATLTIPAGSTTSLTTVGVQTGTVAGTITITAQLVAITQDITPTPAPVRTIVISPGPPSITTVTATRTSTGFTVTVTGFATTRQITQALFQFNAASGSTIQNGSATISTDTLFSQYYQSPAAAPFGGQFSLTIPFTVQGSTQGIVSVTVTLVNSLGNSTAVTANLQ
jgi:hypothetical protein